MSVDLVERPGWGGLTQHLAAAGTEDKGEIYMAPSYADYSLN